MPALANPPPPTYVALRVIETARDSKHRLTELPQINFGPREDRPRSVIECYPERTRQTIVGFGGAFTESTGYVLQKLDAAKRAEVLRQYFDPKAGIGYSLCRTHINSCDFSLGNWACDEVPGDVELKHFNLDRTREHIIPIIHEAQRVPGAKFHLFASPWSPPAWMKTNGMMNEGGQLLPQYRDAWALHYVKYIQAMEAEGIPIWGLTVQNEPAATQRWDSCVYSAEEERDFVRDHLGPTLRKHGLGDRKLMVWDHNCNVLLEHARAMYDDPKAAAFVWGTAFHWYSGPGFKELAETHEAYPNKALLFTEGCCENGVKIGFWEHGERYGHNMIGHLRNWTTGWVDWNMALDEVGGPNHVGNFCDAPVIVDTKTKEVHYQPAFYYIGQISKFVRPGAVCIESTTAGNGLESVAFRNPDRTVAVVVMNGSNEAKPVEIVIGPQLAAGTCPPHAIQTYVTK
ncbi:MAG: glycoside hydrolase family 30 protein [Chthoniobacterales bacterium]|nr:glycoside hydrolase family 30 protein [Chthoniobacterales bacterium]